MEPVPPTVSTKLSVLSNQVGEIRRIMMRTYLSLLHVGPRDPMTLQPCNPAPRNQKTGWDPPLFAQFFFLNCV